MTDSSPSPSAPDAPAQEFFGWKNIGLLFVMYMLGIGFVYYGFNIIFPEMVLSMGWSRGDAAWGHTVHGLLFGFAAPLVALATNKYGARKTMAAGLSVVVIGCVLLATVITTIWQWVLVWGVVMSLGFAFGGLIPVQTTVAHWFDARRGTALGLVMTAGGVGGFVGQPMYTWVIETFGGWQSAWMVATGFALAALLLTRFMVNKPEDIGQHPDGLDPGHASHKAAHGASKVYKTRDTWTLREAVGTLPLWIIVVLFLASVMPIYLLMVHGVLHMTDLNYSRMEAAGVLSFMLAGSAFARFPAGWLGDRIDPRRIVFILYIGATVALAVLWKAPNASLLITAGVVFGMAYGSILVMGPTLIANYYGALSLASINGFIFPVQIVIASMVPVAAGYMADSSGNYDIAFMVVIGFMGFAAPCALLARPPQKKSTNTN